MNKNIKIKRNEISKHNFSYIQVTVHCLIYILRGICLCFMNYLVRRKPQFSTVGTNKLSNNIIYAFQLNSFQLYSVLSSIINENHFEYILSLVLIVHNALLTFVMLVIIETVIFKTILTPAMLTGALYLIDFLYTLKSIKDQKSAHNFDTFKKIGVDKRINQAFHTRKIVRYHSFLWSE